MTLQLVATDTDADDAIAVSSEIVVSPGTSADSELAETVATRARDAARHLLVQIPAFASTGSPGFVPLAGLLPKV